MNSTGAGTNCGLMIVGLFQNPMTPEKNTSTAPPRERDMEGRNRNIRKRDLDSQKDLQNDLQTLVKGGHSVGTQTPSRS